MDPLLRGQPELQCRAPRGSGTVSSSVVSGVDSGAHFRCLLLVVHFIPVLFVSSAFAARGFAFPEVISAATVVVAAAGIITHIFLDSLFGADGVAVALAAVVAI